MTVQGHNVGDELRRLVAEGKISEDSLVAITGISSDALASFLGATENVGMSSSPPVFSGDEGARLSILTAQLTAGAEIDDDERLQAILETLTSQYGLTRQNIALLTRTGPDDLDRFLRDPGTLPPERKYELAVRVFYLLNATSNATPDPSQP